MFCSRGLLKPLWGASLRGRTATRLYSTNPMGPNGSHRSQWKRRFNYGLAFGLVSGFAFGLYFNHVKKNRPIGLESLPKSDFEVKLQPPTDTPPFPPTVAINREIFQALGTGVRSVTFLNFHVYAVGVYIAADDIHQAREIVNKLKPSYPEATDAATWEKLLQDEKIGSEIISELCKQNVRFAVRIVPTRNTDFNHLRDGFVRSITNHPEFKKLQSTEVGQSIGEIKRAFGRKRKLKKGEVVTWSRDINGGMTAWYGDTDEDKELLGALPHSDVARLFFLQYLTGSKPISPSLKAHAIQGLAHLIV